MGVAWSLGLVLGVALAAQEGWTPPPLTYSAKPVRGVVVDAGMGSPLEGVIVVAQWVLYQGGPGHAPGHRRRLHVIETTTDDTGTYRIPGWGPKPNTWAPWTRLLTRDPELLFLKRGYTPLGVQNRWERNDAVRISEWDGKTVKLEKFTGTPDDWARELSSLQITLAWGDVMEWRELPRMVLSLELERLILAQRPMRGSNIDGLSSLGTTIEEVRRFLEGQK